jgi:hypothetical protein
VTCPTLWLTLHAWCVLALFDSTQLLGFQLTYALIRRTQPKVSKSRPCSPEDIVWAIDEACVWYFKRVTCLQRAAVATWLLRRHSVPAALVIGYRPMPFESHAWVEVNGIVINDRPQYQRFFTVLDRL